MRVGLFVAVSIAFVAASGGAIAGDAGRGAGIGAAVGACIGTVRRAGQRNQVYQSHFNECMRWP